MSYKEGLYQYCLGLLKSRVEEAEILMDAAQQASNSETKSSAGDKYETGRAMAQLEKERHARRHSEALDALYRLESIGCRPKAEEVEVGSFVETKTATYYLLVGLGMVEYEGRTVHVISEHAPMGQILLGLEEEEDFVFRDRESVVRRIE